MYSKSKAENGMGNLLAMMSFHIYTAECYATVNANDFSSKVERDESGWRGLVG